jgi:hypothetical protein
MASQSKGQALVGQDQTLGWANTDIHLRTSILPIMMATRMKKIVALAFGLATMLANAQVSSNDELKKLVKTDQSDREAESIDWPAVDLRDKERATRVVQILRDGQIKTAEDFYNAGMIFQHGSSPDDIKLAFSLATISARLAPANPAPKWLAAAAWDRYMMWKKLPQWYGTQSQFFKDTGKTSLYPVLPDAVTDAERAEAQVPPLSKIISDIAAKNK